MPLPDDVDGRELDYDVRKQLLTLSKETAELVSRHLVMAGRLMDDEPEAALAHARAARALAGRVGAVREANGLVAYTAGEWAEALSELRTARRITGDPEHLAVMADCERALGRPDRALMVAEDPQAASLSPAAKLELLIVSSGARRDLGQAEAAVVSLQVAALEGPVRPWTARLRYAYADALLDAGRVEDARIWFGRAAEADEEGSTDAVDRILEMDGVVLEDLQADEEPHDDESRQDETSTPDELQKVAQEVAVTANYATQEPAGDGIDHTASADAPAGEAVDSAQPVPAERAESADLEREGASAASGPMAALERALTLSEEAARGKGLTFSGSADDAAPLAATSQAPGPSTQAASDRSTDEAPTGQSSEKERQGPTVGAGPAFVEPGTADNEEPDLRLFE